METGRRGRRLFLKIATATIALLSPILLLELGLRIAGYNPFKAILEEKGQQGGARAVMYRKSYNDDMVYELVPNSRSHFWSGDGRINSHGFRDKEYSVEKPADVLRIIALGDSVTFAMRLPIEATYPKQLESRFRDAGDKVEVLNMGVSGYDTLQEVAQLEHLGLRFSPDFVVLGYGLNDVALASTTLRYIEGLAGYDSPIYRWRIAQLFAVKRDNRELGLDIRDANDESTFAARFKHRIVGISSDTEQTARLHRLREWISTHRVGPAQVVLDWYTSEARIGRLRYAFEKLRRLADEHDFPVAVVIIPHVGSDRGDNGYQMAYAITAAEARRVGFDVLNLYDAFATEGFDHLRVRPNDKIHANERGHEIIADNLYEYFVNQEGWVSAGEP